MSHAFDREVNAFRENVILGIERLADSLGPDFVTLEWLQQAVDFLRSTHAGVLNFVDRLQLPISAGEEWINEYMNESAKLLDVCNLLKRGIGGLGHYQMHVELVLRALQNSSNSQGSGKGQFNRVMQYLADCEIEAVKLDRENRPLAEEKVEALGWSADSYAGRKVADLPGVDSALVLMRNTSYVVAKILLCGLVHASGAGRVLKPELTPSDGAWGACVSRMQRRFSEEIRQKQECIVFLHEFEQLHVLLQNLSVQMQAVQGKVQSRTYEMRMKLEVQKLKQSSDKLKNGLEVVEWHVNNFFDEIIEGRTNLLTSLSQSTI
ncbi:hypothetical protein O6H91_17G052900 [Diphasiastrum complanatum]|nr:hypothetical protein O6H91_17G052900 [Diphasiastrum complanatum]